MYAKTDPKPNFTKLEHEVLKFWQDNNIFKKSSETKTEPFTFYDGPPFANGLPHWGHLGVSAIKDMVARFQTMKGKKVSRDFGWDCHGFPAENAVEKEMKKSAKDIVAESSVAAFCDLCAANVTKYTKEWESFIDRIGRWVDMKDGAGYRTMDKNFMESVIWAIAELNKKGLLYKDYKVNPYDWKFGTIVSNSEASQDYRDVVDDSITVWFELEDGRRIMAWTTTPWTLPANSALAVNPDLDYAIISHDGHEYIVAAARAEHYEKELGVRNEEGGVIKGSELIGLKYKPLFPYNNQFLTPNSSFLTVIAAPHVTADSGTGIVHMSPAFGEEDFIACKALDANFPIIVNVDDFGNFTNEVTDFAGMNIFDAAPVIIKYLKSAGNLIKKEQYKHSYPYGERSKEKLIYRATEAWYIDVPAFKDRLIANNNLVHWTAAGRRFADWIANAKPWGITRNRYWGVPLPIWQKGDEYKIFGSIAEMEEFFGTKITDLHRPTLDALTKDGWTRIPDVLDCWFESGSMPFASLHYPFENKEKFEQTFPADFIVEGQDQTRGWFYSLMVLATALFDKPAFKTVGVSGHTVDENKKKFSKSLGNYSDPSEQIEKFGADAVRLFIMGSNFMKAEPVPVDKEGVVFAETIKTILTPLWNAYHFFTLYANAGKITAKKHPNWFGAPNVMDRYILAELNELFDVANKSLEAYQPDTLVKHIVGFLDTLNNWYIRLNRQRFWDEEQDAFDTLWTVLAYLCRVLAPIAPFMSDFIFRAITGGHAGGEESVHLCKYPHYTENNESFELLGQMRKVQQVVSAGKQLREIHRLRNRLPLSKIEIAGWSKELSLRGATSPWQDDIIKNELNIKEVSHTEDVTAVADKFVYLLTPKLGLSEYRAEMGAIQTAFKNGDYKIIDGKLHIAGLELSSEYFEERLTVKDGITGAALSDNTAVVILDINITPELEQEGLANDILRFIQDTRKTIGLDVSDRIGLTVSGDDTLVAAVGAHEKRIMEDALVTEIKYADTPQL